MEAAGLDPGRVLFTVRHAIMSTNYSASVVEVLPGEIATRPEGKRQWFGAAQLHTLPLTGLARKVLLKMKLMPHSSLLRNPLFATRAAPTTSEKPTYGDESGPG